MRSFIAVVFAGAAWTAAAAATPKTPPPTPQRGAKSPACDLLSAEDVRKATGHPEYKDGTTGDAPGEGLGGGTSCQWSAGVFSGSNRPIVSVILVPKVKGKHYVDLRKEGKVAPGCSLDTIRGVGQVAFFETCAKAPELPLFVKTDGENDLVIAMQLRDPATADSAKPTLVALAKAALAKIK